MAQRAVRLAELDQAEAVLAAVAAKPAVELLDALPAGSVDFARLPPALARRLFETSRLEIHYNRNIHGCRLRITLAADAIDRLTHTARQVMDQAGGHTDKDGVPIYNVPPVGFEPTHPPPERRTSSGK